MVMLQARGPNLRSSPPPSPIAWPSLGQQRIVGSLPDIQSRAVSSPAESFDRIRDQAHSFADAEVYEPSIDDSLGTLGAPKTPADAIPGTTKSVSGSVPTQQKELSEKERARAESVSHLGFTTRVTLSVQQHTHVHSIEKRSANTPRKQSVKQNRNWLS